MINVETYDVVAPVDIVSSISIDIPITLDIDDTISIDMPITLGYPGPAGPTGPAGDIQQSFETVSKNLLDYEYVINYNLGELTSIVYNTGVGSITKTLGYTGDKLTSITLSGDIKEGISTTKTLGYIGDNLSTVSYS